MEYKKINQNAVKTWFITRFIVLIVLSTIYLLLFFLLLMPNFGDIIEVKYSLIFFGIFLFLFLLINAFVFPLVEYKQWKYLITKDKIELNFGVITKKKIIIPISRIQFLDIKQGPIYRRFGLTCLTISTAGSTHEIPALSINEANQISEYLKAIIEMSGISEQ